MSARDYTEEYIEINDITQYFLHYPSPQKEVAIMLHGGPGQSEAHLAYSLRPYWDFCNVVYYDQRGAGKTQIKNKSKPDSITLEALMADLKQTIQYVKGKYQTDRIILIGHSWGSILGTEYILKYPDDVICYIGYGQVVDLLRGEKIGYEKLKDSIERKGAKKDIKKLKAFGDYPYGAVAKGFMKTAMAFRKMQAKHGYAPDTAKVRELVLKSPIFSLNDIFPMLKSLKTNKNLMDIFLQHRIWDKIKYQIPVYYILGRNDWQTPSILVAEYFDKIDAPKKGIYWVEDAGHLTDVGNPEGFCKSVKEIITQL
ncbi:MAG: alpha/beta hydrolase [Oscillospiraceae bacterium]|nr:alpha/beta hydrolase [Oscillospiraceae bacterium]